MDKDFIAGLIAIVERSAVAELDYSEGDRRIRIIGRRGPSGSAGPPIVVVEPAAYTEERKDHRIIAGITGLFHRSPAPGAAPFVSVGDDVEEGQTLALLEAMKMLTPVEADLAGQVASIDAADGATVERGALLFTIRRKG